LDKNQELGVISGSISGGKIKSIHSLGIALWGGHDPAFVARTLLIQLL
jgi:hypothetical protein